MTQCVFRMTTTGEDPFDSKLASILQDNQTEYHIYAPMVKCITTREGVVGGGPELTTQLNSSGTTTMNVILPCPPSEAIVFGSIEVSAVVSVKHSINAEWQSGNADSNNYVSYDKTGGAATDKTDPVDIPKFALNCQFAYVDIKIGSASASVNSVLPSLQGSTGGTGILAMMDAFANKPVEGGVYSEFSNDVFNGVSRTCSAHNIQYTLFETIYHPLNPAGSSLSTEDSDDHHVLRIWPRGMPIHLSLTSRQYSDRTHLTGEKGIGKIKVGSTDKTNTSQTGFLFLHFAEAKVWFKTVTIQPFQLELEQRITRFAIFDLGIDAQELTAGQQSVTIPVTRTDTSVVPQFTIAFIGPPNLALTRCMPWSDEVRGIATDMLQSVTALFQGNNLPEFMKIYNDGKMHFLDKRQLTDMRNAWLGKVTGYRTRSRGDGVPRLERQLITLATATVGGQTLRTSAFHMFLLVTDPNTALVRESSGSALIGRLDLQLTLTKAAKAGDTVYTVRFTKHQVQINKQLEVPGSAPQYELDPSNSRPAYTQTVSLTSQWRGSDIDFDASMQE